MTLPDLLCSACGKRYSVESLVWRCPCGGMLDVVEFASTAAEINTDAWSMWRYPGVLPVLADKSVSMGEGMTPLVSSPLPNIRFKVDMLMPTGSFKDRGAVVLASLAARLGVTRALVDSSGNAGTAAAAYLGRAGIACQVFVPAATSPGKLAQIRAHGADVVLVDGSRADTAEAAMAAASASGIFYASHVFHPYFLHGVKTYGYELWEQFGRELPDSVLVPVGNGTMLLGCYLAFRELFEAGLSGHIPVIVGVQAANCAPLAIRSDSAPFEPRTTVAEGIAISAPPRGDQILSAVQATGGSIVTVDDAVILAARDDLASRGLYVEPTSAVCWAAVRTYRPQFAEGTVVVPLCGTGLKTTGY